MRIAVLSDIHSNLEALRAVLHDIGIANVDEIWCLGDIVGYGPSPNECIEIIRDKCTLVLKGNHDAGAIGEVDLAHFNVHGKAAIKWTRTQITEENKEYLKKLPLSAVRENVTVAHATPAKPETWQYVFTWPDAEEAFKAFSTPLCFIGHTHLPLIIGEDRNAGTIRKKLRHLVNVGSVGQPRDGNPKASFGIVDTGLWEYSNIRVAYDIAGVVEGLRKAGLPKQLGKRLFVGV